jgi:hypothetical protein
VICILTLQFYLEMENSVVVLSWSGANSNTGSGTVVRDLLKFKNDSYLITEDKSSELLNTDRVYKFKNIFRNIPRFHHTLGILLVPILLIKALRISKKLGIKKIVVIFPDELYLISGYFLSRIMKLDLYIYYHNSFSFNRKYISSTISKLVEKEVFIKSKHIFFISEGLRNVYTYYYADLKNKSSVLEHTINKQPKNNTEISNLKYFLFIGSINQSNIDSVLVSFDFILNHTNYIINVAGPNGTFLNKYLIHDRLIILGFLSEYDLLLYQNGSIANIIIHGGKSGISYVENQTILPTRFMKQLGVMNNIIVIGQKFTFLHFFASNFRKVYFVDILNIFDELPNVINSCIANEFVGCRDLKIYSEDFIKSKYLSVLD